MRYQCYHLLIRTVKCSDSRPKPLPGCAFRHKRKSCVGHGPRRIAHRLDGEKVGEDRIKNREVLGFFNKIPAVMRHVTRVSRLPTYCYLPYISSLVKSFTDLLMVGFKTLYMGVSSNGGTPKHPKLILFSRKTHGCWVAPF